MPESDVDVAPHSGKPNRSLKTNTAVQTEYIDSCRDISVLSVTLSASACCALKGTMTPEQKTAVLDKINSEIGRISNDIKMLIEITRPVAAEDMDDITRMDSIVNKSVNEAALTAARSRLIGLEYALKRIDAPDFGYCLECGEAISYARLLAMPETTRCIDCAK